jgi:hypothetical protein
MLVIRSNTQNQIFQMLTPTQQKIFIKRLEMQETRKHKHYKQRMIRMKQRMQKLQQPQKQPMM